MTLIGERELPPPGTEGTISLWNPLACVSYLSILGYWQCLIIWSIMVFEFSLFSTIPALFYLLYAAYRNSCTMRVWASWPVCKALSVLPERNVFISFHWLRCAGCSWVLCNALYLFSRCVKILQVSYLPVFPTKFFEGSYYIIFVFGSPGRHSIRVCWWTSKCLSYSLCWSQ